jgi:cytosine/adenosine deaminase-related metal-dependent hydrolase
MARAKTIAVRGRYVWAVEGDRPRLLRDRYVIVEGNTVAGVATDRPAGADHVIELEEAFVLPGLLNLHNHITSSVLFRGITEDRPAASATDLVYNLLMPLGDLAAERLPEEDLGAVLALGMLELIKGGTTTLLEMFRIQQEVTFRMARDMGLRFYAAPYLFSTSKLTLGADGMPRYETRESDAGGLDRWKTLFRTHDGSAGGRIRVALGPHGTDSCGPDLLREVRKTADELGCRITTHLSQTRAEVELIQTRHGKTPEEYLAHVGLLGPDLLVAHCVESSDAGLDLLERTGTTVVSCPLTFARQGQFAPFGRFRRRGLRTVLGTDGYRMDLVGEMRQAGFVSKLHAADPAAATAPELLHAATAAGAEALGRRDLGRIAPGARADLVVIDMARPHLQPVSDPLRTLVWNASGADVSAVMVDGRLLVENGRYLLGDEGEIVRRGARAARKLWDMAEAAGITARRDDAA